MKKIFLYILAGSLCFTACKKDDVVDTINEPEDINVQNNYDDQAIRKFMDENYLDAQGNVRTFSTTDASDDNEKKLSDLPHETLPSGTVFITRPDAQPTNGVAIAKGDSLRIMMNALTFVATDNNGSIVYGAKTPLTNYNTISETGIPVVDPKFYYIKNNNKLIKNATTDIAKQKSYYMIEGFNEALQKYKAFDKADGESYNLQGVIIVPSRAAFARDSHYNYSGYSFRNRTFVFNFQVYKNTPRAAD
ncbi:MULTISPECIES: hypothetical protein [Chryseobacterium]|jgi:hypothetical protein|uniref:hypothetical protein n=1 Tax=Chryseobacterium TaxID=59732 RepID=UPI0009D8D31B|nr:MULTISPECIES: hypothetical protein [Chryseobacterium]MDR6544173.1 hypothetical protein [Chryseobacterium rhizosphaerae]SMC85840.1 hypothetical protein SAMN02787074_3389 [Chryseobacterium sp. YR221]